VFNLEWSERAAAQFDDLLAYIAAENPINARIVRERILNTLSKLESYSLGLPGPKETFKLYVQKTSYFVIFRRDDKGGVGIRGFLHASRDWEDVNWDEM
jgi:plasmid stabilization system protein ParE